MAWSGFTRRPRSPIPLDDGTAVLLERDWKAAEEALGSDGKSWHRLMEPLADHWAELSPEILGPPPLIPKHPLLMAAFAWRVAVRQNDCPSLL